MAFITFTMLCNHHLCWVLEYLSHPKRKPHTHSPTTSHPPGHPQLLTMPNLLSVSVVLPVLDISYLRNLIICGPLCLASFTCHVSKVHPYHGMYQHCILLYGWIIFQYMDILHFVYCSFFILIFFSKDPIIIPGRMLPISLNPWDGKKVKIIAELLNAGLCPQSSMAVAGSHSN